MKMSKSLIFSPENKPCIYKKTHYLNFDLDPKVKGNIAQYPLHHVVYVSAKFEVVMTNCLGADIITQKSRYSWAIIGMPAKRHLMRVR